MEHIYVQIVDFIYCLLIELDLLLCVEIIVGRLTLSGKLFCFLPFSLSFPPSIHLFVSNNIAVASTENLEAPCWNSDL